MPKLEQISRSEEDDASLLAEAEELKKPGLSLITSENDGSLTG
jgi:hypothetical protein